MFSGDCINSHDAACDVKARTCVTRRESRSGFLREQHHKEQ